MNAYDDRSLPILGCHFDETLDRVKKKLAIVSKCRLRAPNRSGRTDTEEEYTLPTEEPRSVIWCVVEGTTCRGNTALEHI